MTSGAARGERERQLNQFFNNVLNGKEGTKILACKTDFDSMVVRLRLRVCERKRVCACACVCVRERACLCLGKNKQMIR